jgi:putative hemolysin
VEQGGRLDIVETAEGQVGFCTLPDGRRVEEWALFREAHEATDPPPSARSDAAPR